MAILNSNRIRAAVFSLFVALLLAAPLALAAPADATYNVTWTSKGTLKRVGPFKDVRKRVLTIREFSKKFGKPSSKRVYDGGLLCEAVWKKAGISVHFSRFQTSRKACGKTGSDFHALGVYAKDTALWTFGGKSVPPLASEDVFRAAFPESKLNYSHPDGQTVPQEVGWSISQPRSEEFKPTPVADVTAVFKVSYLELDPVNDPDTFGQLRTLNYVWVVKEGLWNN
ncbi:MAG: hypothetical protein ACRDKE_07570 [Solirubrobacterales bacterium]